MTRQFRTAVSRVLALFARRRLEANLSDEIQGHLDLLADEHRRGGLSESEARLAARREFGGTDQIKEIYRDQRGFPLVDTVLRDVRYAVRTLRKAPGFATVAVLTLMLGIGTSSAIFSLVRGVLLEPLSYADSGRLVLVQADTVVAGASRPLPMSFGFNEFDWWAHAGTIEAPAFYDITPQVFSGGEGSEILDGTAVSGAFFSTMAGPMAAGRGLGPDDDSSPSAVISDRLSRRLFHTPAEAIGRPLTLTAQVYTVVGVAGPSFQFPSAGTDVWLPAGLVRTTNPRCCFFSLVARLRRGQTPAQAGSEAESIARARYPASATAVHARAIPLSEHLVAAVRRPLAMLFAAVLLVLIVACVNLVSLLLARNASRSRELSIRFSLGASRARLMSHALTESTLLAIVGAGLGTVFASAVLASIVRIAGSTVPHLDSVRIDASTIVFAAALAIATAVATGLAPALLSAQSAGPVTHTAGRAAAISPHRRLRRALCSAECAVSFVLLVGAVLLGRSLVNLMRTDLGVTTDHVLTTSLNLGFGQRPTDAQTLERIERVVERVSALPGVRAAGAGSALPPQNSRMRITLRRAGESVDYQASAVPATPGYFSTLRMRLVTGRFFTENDDAQHPPVMIMSEDTARRFFGEGDPLGKTLKLPVLREGRNSSELMTLVGVIANVKYSGLAAPPDDAVYRPFAQQPFIAAFLVVRTAANPDDLSSTIRRQIAAIDPGIVTSSPTSLESLVFDAAAQPRFQTILMASFAGLSVAIAAVGLYGMIAYSVAQRTTEIGIRMALGADAGSMRVMVLQEGVRVGLVGVAIGAASAFAFVRALAGLLYGVEPTNVLSFVSAGAALLAICVAASYIPAHRASRVDPLVALRCE